MRVFIDLLITCIKCGLPISSMMPCISNFHDILNYQISNDKQKEWDSCK